ncbi:MAG: BlaI/MecI/CopY family transcriptional regulator [Planctomycetes bacterium]|nr:BlaI/MecI/CopY family transcriptional regulator [Planctomycetota bacterium]
MSVLWERHPLDALAVARAVASRHDWSARTVKTLLSRLAAKGALGFDRDGRRYLYSPRVTLERCGREASRTFLDRVFGGAVRPALLYFVRESDLTPEEVAEMERLLDGKEDDA